MVYEEFTFKSRGRIDRFEVKLVLVLAGFSALLSIPMVMMLGLGMSGSEWYWAVTGNIFLDWSIYYLNFIPLWLIFSILLLSDRLSPLNLFKWILVFYLGFWLFYDWVWWLIISLARPDTFSFSNTFYFDIVIPNPPMWLFLMMAVIGFAMALVLLKREDSWANYIPQLLFLIYIYGAGTIGEVLALNFEFYVLWGCIFIPLIIISFFITVVVSRDI